MLRPRRFLAAVLMAVSMSSFAIGTRAVAQFYPDPVVIFVLQVIAAYGCQDNGNGGCGGACLNGAACKTTTVQIGDGPIEISCNC